jgi:PAS domain S-box-containing protein
LARYWANRSLRVKGLVVVALPLALLLAAVAALSVAGRAEADAAARVRAAVAIQRDINQAHALLAEAASGVRGYLLTGQERFLQPYQKAEAELPQTFARLDAEIEDPQVRRSFERIVQLTEQKREGLAALRNMADDQFQTRIRRPEILAALVANKAVLDAMRTEIEAMQSREDIVLATRQARAQSVQRASLILTALTIALGVLGSLGAVYLFSTGIVRRVQALEVNAGRLERGEPLLHLPAEADEIGRLARKLEEAGDLLRAREKALRDGEERFRLVIDGVQDYGIFALDPAGHVVSWNAGAERIKGWQTEEILGQSFTVFYPIETRQFVPATMLQRAQEKGRAEDEGWRLRKDGSRFFANVVVTALRDETGRLRGYSKVTRDITERKRAEEALKAAREAAITANLAKSEFLSRTSHELRTPLSAILGFAQLLELDKPSLTTQQANATQQILKAGRHLLGLINEVLDISSIESGQIEFQRTEFDLREAIAEACDLAAPIAQAQRIVLRRDLPERPILVNADRRRIVQVALNLLSNAVKYNRPNGTVIVDVTQSPTAVRVAVSDEGAGVLESEVDRLFTPFDRLGKERTSHIEGTGLGLALSKRLIEAMKGEIGFFNRPQPDRGAQFWFTLPLAPSDSSTTDENR